MIPRRHTPAGVFVTWDFSRYGLERKVPGTGSVGHQPVVSHITYSVYD